MAQRSNILTQISKNVNKKGEIKAKTKQETKTLKKACVHHQINKKGKIRPRDYKAEDGIRVCLLCGHRIPTKIYSKESQNQIIGDFEDLLSQLKFIAVAIDAGAKTIDGLAKLSVDVSKVKKIYKRTTKIAVKRDTIKNRKRKNGHNNEGGSNSYGSWKSTR